MKEIEDCTSHKGDGKLDNAQLEKLDKWYSKSSQRQTNIIRK
jgi:hypothetical protein